MEFNIKKKYSLLIAILAVAVGFTISTIFLMIACLVNKRMSEQISGASANIVSNIKEVFRPNKLQEDSLLFHI